MKAASALSSRGVKNLLIGARCTSIRRLIVIVIIRAFVALVISVEGTLLWTTSTLLLNQVIDLTIGTVLANFCLKIEVLRVYTHDAGVSIPKSSMRTFALF